MVPPVVLPIYSPNSSEKKLETMRIRDEIAETTSFELPERVLAVQTPEDASKQAEGEVGALVATFGESIERSKSRKSTTSSRGLISSELVETYSFKVSPPTTFKMGKRKSSRKPGSGKAKMMPLGTSFSFVHTVNIISPC